MTQHPTRDSLADQILEMSPWHHEIRLTDDLTIGEVFGHSGSGTVPRHDNEGVTLINPRGTFMDRVQGTFPDGLAGKRFLDCACNAGVYCFYARESGADYCYGFDVREHWIRQAKFVQQHRTVAPTDQIDFETLDLYDLPQKNLDPFELTFFCGIFYHLPDPIHGLKIAAELTSDIIVVNTASIYDPDNPGGLTPRRRPGSDPVMSGVSELAWLPNGPKAILLILYWQGFREFKLTKFTKTGDRHRFEVVGARQPGRLEQLNGSEMHVKEKNTSKQPSK